jgi:hypothetical protein
MNIRALTRDVPLYLKALRIASEIRLRLVARQIMLLSSALAIALIALVFINVALYQAMLAAWGPVWTPAVLGIGNALLAAILATLAARSKPGADLEIVDELQKTALARIQEDLSGPGEGLGLGLLGADQSRYLMPIISLIVGALRRARKTETK